MYKKMLIVEYTNIYLVRIFLFLLQTNYANLLYYVPASQLGVTVVGSLLANTSYYRLGWLFDFRASITRLLVAAARAQL